MSEEGRVLYTSGGGGGSTRMVDQGDSGGGGTRTSSRPRPLSLVYSTLSALTQCTCHQEISFQPKYLQRGAS